MASSAKKVSLCLLLTLLCSLHTHARDSQFFNKIPSTTNNVVVPTNQQEEQQQPNFLPQNENSYGLYGHESGQNPPSTAAATTAATTTTPDATTTTPFETEFKQPEHKYLPKNYNPVAYVTVPENDDVKESIPFNEETNFSTNNNNNNENNNNENNNENNNSFYTGEETYYNNQQQEGEPEEEEEAEFRKYPTAAAANNNNYYYNGGSRFNSQPESNAEFRTGAASTNRRENYYFNNNGGSSFNSQPQGDTDFIDAAALTSRGNYFDNGAGANGFQPQGMSDTRFVENGKYFYDVNSGKYSSNHPYQSLRGAQAQNQNKFSNRNLFGNNANQFNAGGFNNREEFQYEENMP